MVLALLAAPAAAEAAEPVHGLKGEYYRMSQPGARDFAELGGVLLDPSVDLPGLVGAFQALTGRGEHTTARWTGRITAPATGDWTFWLRGDDGFRIFVDDRPVIDHWQVSRGAEVASAPIPLVAGQPHDVRVEMFQDGGGADLFLSWAGPGQTKRIVPESAFTPPDGFQDYPVDISVPPAGRRLVLDFDAPVTDVEQVAAHLVVEVDTTPMPIESVSVAGQNRLVVTLGAPIQQAQRVRVTYDGKGGLKSGGEPVPLISRSATNNSTHRLTTRWGHAVDREHPLPEYPRPQLVRDRWLNLNGPWEFAGATDGEQPVFGRALGERITVPYPVESLLSGIERREQHMFYRKLVTVPNGWQIGSARRLKLNFGAVDHHARVYVNGTLVAEHTGGYTAFSADITDALRDTGKQEILVSVTDTTGVDQPIGKQSLTPGGIVYTPTSGIWQTVWLEPVTPTSIDSLVVTPTLDSLTVRANSAAGGTVTATAFDKGGRKVGSVTGAAGSDLRMAIRDPHLWTPDDPYLYDLRVTLSGGDRIESYFGLRTVGVEKVGGFPKLVLNGKPIFSLATLDQGFWPDGLYTAPSDEALRWDIEATKRLGFNAIRKHIKVEPARWYRHADELGVLVWQDFVSATIRTTAGQQAWRTEADRTMAQVHNSPAVIGWVVFNEGWGEWDREETGRIAEQVKAADPSRIVNAHSGVNCCDSKGDSGKGDVIDHHDYLNQTPPWPDATRMAMDGEHGGFTLRTPGHMWPGAPANIYSGVADKAALTAKYVDNTQRFYVEAAGAELSGSVYTQITDLENELNGLWTYDRRQIKVDTAPVRAINRAVLKAGASPAGLSYPGRGDWDLDEGQGTTAGDPAMTLQGNPQWVPGVSGTALSFDGDDSADTAAPVVDTTKDYSVAAWVTLDSLPGNYASAVSQDGRQTESPFYLQYGQGAFAFSTPGGNRARLAITPALDRWYHLVGVRSGNEIRLYVDGVRAGVATAGPVAVGTGAFTIGRAKYAGNKTDYWQGDIDEVHAYGHALTDAEVAALYETNSSVPSTRSSSIRSRASASAGVSTSNN